MSDPELIDVDPVVFNATSESIAGVIRELGAAQRRLHEALGALGPAWGGGDLGDPFAQAYVPAVEHYDSAFGSYLGQLGYASRKLAVHAEGFTTAEAEIGEWIASWPLPPGSPAPGSSPAAD
jgi:hypothetical protein